MKKFTAQEVRETWLKFFESKGHYIEPSANLIPQNDPTLLWINAGVAALKKYFDGSTRPEHRRITNAQKCIRTNDIENVGHTSRHQTFFEMLGNFSIGDYFRNEVIPWACELLLDEKWFGISNTKLYITYYPDDLATKKLWIDNGMLEDHLVPLATNFWEIGEGPGGPDTEIYFDRGEKYDPLNKGVEMLKNDEDNDRYIEIWNIVFSQYNCQPGVLKRSEYKELPQKNIDTGAGLERFCCVLQGVETNFETDLFYPIILEIQKLTSKKYEGEYLMPYRVIADHIRTCVFALADGESFSNEGRGYVLRRLLRRAMKYAQKLDLYEPFMYKLVRVVINNMKSFYPYLEGKEEYLEKMIKNEEEKFIKTLNKGEAMLNSMIKDSKKLSGEDAFKLYDTYGFPIELTSEIALDKGVEVDIEGFETCLTKQKELARANRKNIESFGKQSKDLLDFKETSTYTYEDDEVKTNVIGLFIDGNKADEINETGNVVFKTTNFYAEMGGEVADTGYIYNDNFRANVEYVGKTPNGCHIHTIKVLYGTLKLNDEVTLVVDHIKHQNIMKNHSATHLLQAALINVLGDGIKQKGSFVNDKYLRFDFSYLNKIDESTLAKVERLVNDYINESIPRVTKVLPIEEAKKEGAISEFNEKYGATVRVVCFGEVSKEFCGGCHVNNSGDIGCFVIKSESAIASGVRRIEAYTGLEAYKEYKEKYNLLLDIEKDINVKSTQEIESKLKAMNDEIAQLKSINTSLNMKLASLQTSSLINEVEVINAKNILIKYLDSTNMNSLMNIHDSLKNKINDYVFILIGHDQDKYPLLVGVSDSYIKLGLTAKDIIKKVSTILVGNGGGKDSLAKGNVSSIDKINDLKGIF